MLLIKKEFTNIRCSHEILTKIQNFKKQMFTKLKETHLLLDFGTSGKLKKNCFYKIRHLLFEDVFFKTGMMMSQPIIAKFSPPFSFPATQMEIMISGKYLFRIWKAKDENEQGDKFWEESVLRQKKNQKRKIISEFHFVLANWQEMIKYG